jgi:para-nitrobenzyl esterase
MPAAKGLFHRAIAQSGSQVRSQTTEQATRTARNVLKAMQIEPNQLDRLQEVPFYVLRDTLTAAENVGQFSPVMDGRTVPAHIFDPVATQISADVPLMIGSMETEVTWNTGQNYDNLDNEALRYYVKTALRTDDATADRTIALYRQNRSKASNLDLYLILAADASGFRVGTGRQADSKAALGKAPVYKYYWNWYSPVRDGELRCMHCMDIPFALNNVQVSAPVLGTGKELQGIADKVSGAWAAFARTGNPNHPGIPHWAPFTTTQRETMVWNVEPRLVNDPHGDELRAVNAIIAQRPVQGG